MLGFLLLILSALMFFFGASAQKVCNSVEGPNYPLFAEVSLMHADSFFFLSLLYYCSFACYVSACILDCIQY